MGQFEIRQFDFNNKSIDKVVDLHYVKDFWPVVYILSNGLISEAYVGETTDAYTRMITHLKNNEKSKLSALHIITSDTFNKSATLDIEANLIKYLSGDGQFRLLNGNLGLANHNYFQKNDVYWYIFKAVWDKLRTLGIAKHSLEYIDNSDLFKYSPYKSLTKEQLNGLFEISSGLLSGGFKNILVEGGAGTGKTILATYLFKILNSTKDELRFNEFGDDENRIVELAYQLQHKYPNPRMALVVPMSSFRSTLKKVFKNVKGLSPQMVISPSELANQKYDIVVVDEAHRLRRRVNLGAYFGSFDKASEKLGFDKLIHNELDWVQLQSEKAILFYDRSQSIKPSDIEENHFVKLKSGDLTSYVKLQSQFRVKGGNSYVDFITNVLRGTTDNTKKYSSDSYELLLFESLDEMVKTIKKRDEEDRLSRLIAGYAWKWVSKNDKSLYDIEIGEVRLRWNSTSTDWINSDGAVEEVGCIHTTQGYDLNYAGIILGNEIGYDESKNEIVIRKEEYHDRNGKQSIKDENDLKEYILNIYKTIMLRGIKGTYIYACDDALRRYLSKYIKLHNEKPTANVSRIPLDEVVPFKNAIPLYNLQAAAGEFSQNQSVGEREWIAASESLRVNENTFACEVVGESMNRVIPNGSICQFEMYTGGSRNGMIVLAEYTNLQDDETGSRYTVKEYHSKKVMEDGVWEHSEIILRPLSNDPTFHDIILTNREEDVQLKVIGVFKGVLGFWDS